MTFNNYQLYRTTPKLSGNMKLDLIVTTIGSKLYVKDFHLRPISDLITYNIIDEDITIRTHQLNIARFYSKTKGDFYSAKADPQLLSDWPIVLTRQQQELYDKNEYHVKTWDDTYWAGSQRMLYSLYGTTHEVMVPVWLEQVEDINDLSIEIELSANEQASPLVTKILKFDKNSNKEYHKKFSEYLDKYFEYTSQKSGNSKCLNVDLYHNETFINGLNVEDGNMQTRTDFNITRNLLYRERPLLESNSLLTNSFNDVHLILPQLINFNICFDLNNWIPQQLRLMFSQRICVGVNVKIKGKTLEKRDLYTNHQYVPRPVNEDIYNNTQYYTDDDKPFNALDYKQDYLCTDLMHKNKIVQPICHWALNTNEDVLFNLYDGFGASFNGVVINHFFGTVNDGSVTVTDPIIPNTSPFGPKRFGDGDEVDYVINNAEHYTFDDPYFVQLSKGWTNGFKLEYKPEETDQVQEILIAGMTTREEFNRFMYKTADTQTVTNPKYYAIWANRWDKDSNNTLPDVRIADNRDPEGYDYKYDVALYHDMDNRWSLPPGQEPDPSKPGWGGETHKHRLEINSYGLYICADIVPWPSKQYIDNGVKKDAKALVIIIWDQQVEMSEENENLIFHPKLSNQNIGFIMEAIREYTRFVKNSPVYKSNPEAAQWFDNTIGLLDNQMRSSLYSGVWYFNNTILKKQDNSVSTNAKEIIYRKSPAADAYVYRFDGLIKPAMYVPAVRVVDGKYQYNKKFGANYFWIKQLYKDNKIYNKYARTGVPPYFPSLSYDCVLNDSDYGECLLYDDKPSRTGDFKEHKWFNKSVIVQYPVQLEAEIDTESTAQGEYHETVNNTIRDTMYKLLKEQVADELWDAEYVRKLYDLKYELLYIKHQDDKLLYTYKITLKLK